MLVTLKEKLPQVGSKFFDYIIDMDRIFLSSNQYNQKIDFIVDIDGNLKFGIGHYKLNNKKETLLMAGDLIINENGKINQISNDSGHYQPNPVEFIKFINSFIIPKSLFEKDFKVFLRQF